MILAPHTSALRYRLAPDADAKAAIEATFEAYHLMMDILDEVVRDAGANLVALHGEAYETVRSRTGLPARLVTLGLADRADYRASSVKRLPLDDKLVNVKTATTLSVGTVRGRKLVSFDVAGYLPGWGRRAPAYLVRRDDGGLDIHFGVTPSIRDEENIMPAESALARVGRLISGLAHVTIEKVEDKNKVAVVQQALREIQQAEEMALAELRKARAEEYRITSRRTEIDRELTTLTAKIETALGEARDDLAKSGIARQLDLEAQLGVLGQALEENGVAIEEASTSLQAIRSALQDGEARLADLRRSETVSGAVGLTTKADSSGSVAQAARAGRAIARAVGVAPQAASTQGIDELTRLHRDKAIEDRLALLKQRRN